MNGVLYLIAIPRLCGARGIRATVMAALDGGVDAVQLRDKGATDAEFVATARALLAICRPRNVPLVLNDRAHLLEETAADGVHLGEDDLAPEAFRTRHGETPILGISTHNRAEAAAAAGRGADYIGLGPMFATASKDLTRAPGGARLVAEAAGATSLPVFCIGGVTAANVAELVAAGARRVAVSAAICGAADPAAAAAAIREALSKTPFK